MDFDEFFYPDEDCGGSTGILHIYCSRRIRIIPYPIDAHVISGVYILGLIITEVPHPKGTVPPFSLWKTTTDLEFIEDYHSHYSWIVFDAFWVA